MKLPTQKTKIVCTIGPASRSHTILKRMIQGGMSVARVNMAHGEIHTQKENIRRIRSAATRLNRPVSILIDLPGPKIRIGKLQSEGLTLRKGARVTLTTRDVPGTAALLPVEYPDFPRSVYKRGIVYLNDGFIQLRVMDISDDDVICRVLVGGSLFSHKGLNLPKSKLAPDAVTEKDLELLSFGLEQGVDIFGLSFVEKAQDIVKVKEFAQSKGKSIRVVAKIERAEAVRNIDSILEVADAIMIARGDLGVQMPMQDVPMIQKRLIRKANLRGRPVITATQMLESMVGNVRPTRAEATDVANAILDGTDAVMLSEETAVGKYPVETVKTMSRIAMSVERQRGSIRLSSDVEEYFRRGDGRKRISVEDVVSLNVVDALRALRIRFVLIPTLGGSTPRRVSRFKPDCWILAFCHSEAMCRFLTLSYGVAPVMLSDKVDNWHNLMLQFMRDSRLAKVGDKVVLAEGMSVGQFDGADSMRIAAVN